LVSIIFVNFVVLSLVCFSGCSEDNGFDIIEINPRLVSANTSFSFKLFEQLVEQDAGENIFVSPSSIAIVLAMVYNGADGETQQAMAETLELQGMSLQELNEANAELIAALQDTERRVQLDIANSLWGREGYTFKPDFVKRNEKFYGADVRNLDFNNPNAPAVINGWVKEKTNGKITRIVDKISPFTTLYVINSLYFKGEWRAKFDKKHTHSRDFTLLDGSKRKVPMMFRTGDYMHYRNNAFQAISIPYGNKRFSMYVFLPDRNSSLEEFHRSLNAKNWEYWLSKFHEIEVELGLPRFKLEYEVKLNDALKAIGMEVAFDPGAANFEGITSRRPFFIDEVKHKTFVEVNEEGTKASAITMMSFAESGPEEFIVDRPFFCAIRDNGTGTVLFMGSIVEP